MSDPDRSDPRADRGTPDPGVDAEALRERLVAAPLEWFDPRGRVLDLGCGTGASLAWMKARGIEARGIDHDADRVLRARERGLDAVEADLVAYLDQVEAGSLDGILLSHVVEHLENEVLFPVIEAGIARLAPGGSLWIVTPNSRSLHGHLEAFGIDPTHVRLHDPRVFTSFMRDRGLEVDVRESEAGPMLGVEIHRIRALQEALVPPGTRIPEAVTGTPWGRIKRGVARRIVALMAPHLDQIRHDLSHALTPIADALERLDRGHEAWIRGTRR